MVPMLANSDPNVPACTRARNHTCSRHVHQHAKLAHDTRSARRKTGTASFLISIFSSSVPGSSSDALVAMVELASSAAANKTANAASCSLGIPLGEGEKWRRVHLVRKQKKSRVEPKSPHQRTSIMCSLTGHRRRLTSIGPATRRRMMMFITIYTRRMCANVRHYLTLSCRDSGGLWLAA